MSTQQARALDEDTLTRRRRVLGEDHPETLRSANNLAADLGALGEHAAGPRTGRGHPHPPPPVLGEDHPDTLTSANNLAIGLGALGEHQQARALDDDTLTRRRHVLGEDHPDTLRSANNLAHDLGEHWANHRHRGLEVVISLRRGLIPAGPVAVGAARHSVPGLQLGLPGLAAVGASRDHHRPHVFLISEAVPGHGRSPGFWPLVSAGCRYALAGSDVDAVGAGPGSRSRRPRPGRR